MFKLFYKYSLAFMLIFLILLKWGNFVFAAEGATIQATIKITVCGNNIKETGEQCDGTDLSGASCVSLGFTSGTLLCGTSCDFNLSNCISGGGGAGGGSYTPPPSQTAVNFIGKAYPKSSVTLLKDVQVSATTVAGADANFQINLSGLSAGNYIFSLYSEDNKGNRSSLLTFPLSVTSGVTTNVSGIFIAPTIAVDKSEVKKGDNIAIFGQSIPQADIIISVNSDEEFFVKTISDKNGIYLYNFDTSALEYGSHYTKSKAAIANQLISGFSSSMHFKVGTKTIKAEEPKKAPEKGDLNNDKKVNLIDFSIVAYWYKRPAPPTAVDFNKDGKVNLVDFSIMAYYWTG